MKKIMFNDKFGLTKAVLSGGKTQTRRIIPADLYNQTDWKSVAEGDFEAVVDGEGYYHDIRNCGKYHIGEEVAIAQKYWDLRECNAFYEALQKADPTFPLECIKGEKGCDNKMFVKADWMPHRIRITGIKVERLQNISEEDAMREGIMEGEFMNTWDRYYYDSWGDVPNHITFPTPIRAFAHLIDKVSGAGTWNSNPWVFVYDFELIK